MIKLYTYRQYVETARDQFFPAINLFKQSRLNNLIDQSMTGEEYLSAVVINSLLTEIEALFIKKLITTTGHRIKFQFSDAQGVVFYRTLLHLPLPSGQIYHDMIRNEWIQLLDQELIRNKLYQKNKPVKTPASNKWQDYEFMD
jgi:hypothetical protein